MLGTINPQTARLHTPTVVYPGRDHVTTVQVSRFDGRRYLPVNFDDLTRVVLSFYQLDDVILFDSATTADVFSWAGDTIEIDLTLFAMPASVLRCQILLYDAEHERGQVLVDDIDTVLEFDFRDIVVSGTLAPPVGTPATLADLQAAMDAHVAEADPHTQYLNKTRGDLLYDPLGSAATAAGAAVSAHVDATDPHTQYLNETRGDSRYVALEPGKGLSANDFTDGLKDKLDEVADGATANQADAYLLARGNHTGTQLAATISDFDSAAEAAAPVQSVQGRAGAVVITAADLSLEEVDNTSDADKPLSDAAVAALNLKLNASLKGADNGLAELDNDGKVPLSQISDAVLGQLSYQGLWNASTNTPTLPSTPAQKGDYYIASVAGTQFGIEFDVGDWLVSDGAAWGKVDNTDAVASVNGKKGAVTITKADVALGNADNTADADKPVSGPQLTALNLKADKTDARFTDAREWTATEVPQLEAETGEATTARKWTSLRVRQATTAWWAGLGTSFGRGFVSLVDAAAARVKLGLGTFATANYDTAPFSNLMPDSGRFAGKMNPLSLTVGAFQSSPLLPGLNGGTHASGGKFAHGAGGSTEAVTSLLAAMGRAGAIYGVEFYVDEFTCGSGTANPSVGLDGVTRYYAVTDTSGRAMFQAKGKSTFATWLRVAEGSMHSRADGQIKNGVPIPSSTAFTPADGWFHFRTVQTSTTGYATNNPGFAGLPGTKIQMACSGFFGGIVDTGIHASPLAANNELMG